MATPISGLVQIIIIDSLNNSMAQFYGWVSMNPNLELILTEVERKLLP